MSTRNEKTQILMNLPVKDNNNEDKKPKDTKKYFIRNLIFKDYEKCLKVGQNENKINYLEKKKTHVDSVKEYKKKLQMMIKMKSIDSIET